jgi:hypothetical protein
LISSTDHFAVNPSALITGSIGAGAPSNFGCGHFDLRLMSALRASGRKVSCPLPASESRTRNGIVAPSRSAAIGTRVEMPAEPA